MYNGIWKGRDTMERLQKAIAASGYTSRRKAEDLIRQGRVEVNGEVVSELGFKVKQGDLIMVDGKALQGENKVYYVFYMQPTAIPVCSVRPRQARMLNNHRLQTHLHGLFSKASAFAGESFTLQRDERRDDER